MSDIDDDDELLQNCKQLTAQISNIKALKLQSMVEMYQSQCQLEFQTELAAQESKISDKYQQNKQKLLSEYQNCSDKLGKAKDEIKKQRNTYEAILEELEEKKIGLNNQQGEASKRVNCWKEKNVNEWKKMSNEEIMKANLRAYVKEKKVGTQE